MSKELGRILRRLREINGLTQQQIAEPLCIDRATYSNYERGVTEPDIDTLKKLAKIFRVSPAELLPQDEEIVRFGDSGSTPLYTLSKDEKVLITRFRLLSKDKKALTLDYSASLLTQKE